MSTTSELGINLGNLQAYIMLLPTLRMMGFVLPPAHEIYHYLNDNELQAFLDIVAIEIDRYFAENFNAEQLDAFNYPCYRFLAKDIQDVSATLPDGLFRLFLDKILTYKQSGGNGLNLRNSNKYATAEFNVGKNGFSMRGGELDGAAMEVMNKKSDDDLIKQLRELKNGPDAAKEELQQYLAHLGSNPATHERLSKIMKALGMANAPSSAAAASASASNARAPASNARAPASNGRAPVNGQLALKAKISTALSNYLASNMSDDAKKNIITQLVQLGEHKAYALMAYAGGIGRKISDIGGGQIIYVGNNGSNSQMAVEDVLDIIATRRINVTTVVGNKSKASFFLGHIRAQEQFFIKITEEMRIHSGKNIIDALRSFFTQFKPSMLDAIEFANAEGEYIEKIKEKKRNLIEKFSAISGTRFVKNNNLNKQITAVGKSYNARRFLFGGAGAVSGIAGAAFHIYRRGYASALGRVTGLSGPPPKAPEQVVANASRPQRFQHEGSLTVKPNERVVLKPGKVADYGTITVDATQARVEKQNVCTPGLWGQNCKLQDVTIPGTSATTRPRTVAEAGGMLPQNPASDLETREISCAQGLAWNNGKQECEARGCDNIEQAFVQSGIDPKTLDGIGQCQVAKAERTGEKLSWGQFSYSFIPFASSIFGEAKGERVPCGQAGITSITCWSSWVQNIQIDLARGAGTALGYTLEAGGAGIQMAATAVGVTGDLALTAGLCHGTRRSVEWTQRGWDEFQTAKSEIEEMNEFVKEINDIKNKLNDQIEIATFEFMVAQFFKYILPQIEELKEGFTTKILTNNEGKPRKNGNGKIIRERFEDLSPEALEANERILSYLSTMVSIDKMNELWAKLALQQKYNEAMQKQRRENQPARALLTANTIAPTAAQAFAGFNQAAPPEITAKDWFELFLPHYMTIIVGDLNKQDTKEKAGITLFERIKRTIAHNIKEKSNTETLGKIRTLEAQLKKAVQGKGAKGFETILKKYDTIAKGRGADQISADFNYAMSCFESVSQSYKARQEAAAAASALQKQKEESDKRMAAERDAAIKAAMAPLKAELNATKAQAAAAQAAANAQRQRNAADQAQRQRNAAAQAQAQRNAALQAQRQRNAEAQAQAAAQRQRNPAQPQAAAPAAQAQAGAPAAPAAPAPGNTSGGQIRNRETRRRRSGGKRKVNRKTRRSRRY